MKHLKYFDLFESKRHNLVLPKNNEELEKLEKMPSFQNIKSIGLKHSWFRSDDKNIRIIRGGSIEIDGPSYNFRITTGGVFYYGAYPVGPQNVELDTWDKVFDYVYIYFLANTRIRNVKSSELENFVFRAIINVNTYSKIKGSEYYEKILELSRKYNGSLTDEVLSKTVGEASKYISDPLAILETPSYKFFDKIFDFEYEINLHDPHQLKVTLGNVTPFGIFNKGEGLSMRDTFYISLEGSNQPGIAKTKVKTYKGLDKAVFKEIKGLSNQQISIWRMGPISIIKSESSLKIFKELIKSYEEGGSFNIDKSQIIENAKDSILNVLENWEYSNIVGFFETVKMLLDDKELGSFGNEYLNTKCKPKIDSMLSDLKNNDPMEYSRIIKEWVNDTVFRDLLKDVAERDSDIIKGGSMLRRFGFGND
jgi:hypothetical protein